MKWEWILIKQECTGCGICADVCPEDALNLTRTMPYPEPVPGKCTGCLACCEECPFDALEVKKLTVEEAHAD